MCNPTRAAMNESVVKVLMLKNASPMICPARSLNAYSRSQAIVVETKKRSAIVRTDGA